MVTAVQELSDGDFSDTVVDCREQGKDTRELDELQLAFATSYSMTKDFQQRTLAAPMMGFIEKQESQQWQEKRTHQIIEDQQATVNIGRHPENYPGTTGSWAGVTVAPKDIGGTSSGSGNSVGIRYLAIGFGVSKSSGEIC